MSNCGWCDEFGQTQCLAHRRMTGVVVQSRPLMHRCRVRRLRYPGNLMPWLMSCIRCGFNRLHPDHASALQEATTHAHSTREVVQ